MLRNAQRFIHKPLTCINPVTMIKIFLLATILSVTSSCFGQNYAKLPDSNAVWQVGWGNSGCFEYGWFADYQYQITGDTNINSLIYKKIDRSGSFDCPPPLLPVSGYMGAFRNNISTKQVFFIPRDSIDEVLLYNFNLNIGDTISGYLQLVSGNIAIIDNIDSVLIGNDYRTRWHHSSTQYFWDGFIIEGIGCDYGLLEGLLPFLSENGSLNCFSENDQTLYPNPDTIPCGLITSIFTPKGGNANQIICYPNPTLGALYVNSKCDHDLKSFEIYNIYGKMVKNGLIQDNGEINISLFQNGMYFVKFYNKRAQLVDIIRVIKK